MLIDRGFPYTGRFYPNFNRLWMPAFKRKRKRFQRLEVLLSRRVAKDRYTSEVYNARVKSQKLLKGVIPRNRFRYVNDAASWGHAMANLYKPLIKTKDWEDYMQNQLAQCRDPLI